MTSQALPTSFAPTSPPATAQATEALDLPRSTPAEQGVDPAGVRALLDALEGAGIEMHSLMVLRHGQVVAEGWWAPYQPTDLHLLYSLSKSFTSAAVGIAVQEGLLSTSDLLTSFFPDSVPADLDPRMARVTVRHLLSMATGHREDTLDRLRPVGEHWGAVVDEVVGKFLSIPPEEEPGTWFTYNNGATLMLSAILTKVTGQRLLDYLRPRLLQPLGILEAYWDGAGQLDLGFTGLHLTTESVAKFGQLLLQSGVWRGRRLLDPGWVAEATRVQVDNPREPEVDWRQGYGYQFWMCRHSAFRGDGAYGQFCLVLPDQDAVVAITAATPDMQAILDSVWTTLLPALSDAETSEANTRNDRTRLLDSRRLSFPLGERVGLSTADLPSSWSPAGSSSGPSGQHGQDQRAQIGPGEDEQDAKVSVVSLAETADGWLLTVTDGQTHCGVQCGYQSWVRTEIDVSGRSLVVAASGAWTDPFTFTAKVVFLSTPHGFTIICDATSATTSARWNAVPLSSAYLGKLALDPARF